MPLILITGYPTSGKTHRAQQIVDYFHNRTSTPSPSNPPPHKAPLRIHYISDDTLSIPRRVYDLESKDVNERSNNASEKDARAKIYGEVKRVLSQGDVVILDAAGGNYIKGWRYQLYCEAKAVRTPSCVVHVGTPVEGAREINEERLRRRSSRETYVPQSDGSGGVSTSNEDTEAQERKVDRFDRQPYERDTWENLVFRYEEPNGMARWDSPLFTVLWDDEAPPCSAIWEAMIGTEDGKRVAVRPNQATLSKPSSGEGYLYELDRVTQEVSVKIVEWGKDHLGEGGGEVVVNAAEEANLVVQLPSNPVGLPMLQRLRRQFINLNRQDGVSMPRIRESFVGYLNDSFQVA